jgi:adenylate cyclase class 2
MYEVEVKAKLRDREAIIKKLIERGCIFSEELCQIDHIFVPKDVSFPPPFDVPVIRVRHQNDKFFLTLKISQSNRQDCIEHELEISEKNKMLDIIKALNFKQVPTVSKKRIKTNFNDIEIVLDVVEQLGEFIEAEKIVDIENMEDRRKIQDELLSFLVELGVSSEDHLLGSKYDIMLYEKYGMK